MKPTKFARTRAGHRWHRLRSDLVSGIQFSVCERIGRRPEDWHGHQDHVENAIRCAFCEAKALEEE